MFIRLLTSIVSTFNHTKCVLLRNISQKFIIQPTLINLHPNEYSQELHYYPFAVKLDRCVGSCNTPIDLSNKVCAPNKTEDLNVSMFNRIAGINESRTLTKHISCNVTTNLMEENVIQIKSRMTINVDLLHVVAKIVNI